MSSSLFWQLAPLLMMAALFGFATWHFIQIYQGSNTRLSQDVSYRNLAIPAEALGAAQQLMALGFTRLGETETRLPATSGSAILWHFRSADKTMTVELVGQPGIGAQLVFYSVFADGSVVETGYPLGETINDQRFHSHRITTSVEDAYQHQLDQVMAWQPAHGSPQRTEDMGDLLRWEGIYRANFGKHKLMSLFVRSYLRPLLLFLVFWSVVGLIGYSKLYVSLPILPLVFGVAMLLLMRRLMRRGKQRRHIRF
jgi:hypothetical protein